MFNFTTQTILNTLKEGDNVIIQNGKTPTVRVNNLRFQQIEGSPENYGIQSIEVKLPSAEVLSEVEFDLEGIKNKVAAVAPNLTGQVSARVALYIGLRQTSVDSYYANAMVYKGKPFYVEFMLDLETGKLVNQQAAEKTARTVLTADKPIMTFEVTSGENGDKLKFVCTDGYQIIREAALQVFDPTLINIDCCNTDGGFVNIIKGVPGKLKFKLEGEFLKVGDGADTPEGFDAEKDALIKPGAEAFGDYNWIMHNLRLPTCANTGYWSITKKMNELPVLGANYVQVTIKVCQDRENIGGMVVGQMTHSVTTHVLYVANTTENMDVLKTVLNTIKGNTQISTTADSKLATGVFDPS